MQLMARLLLTAENFAFGPIGKLLTVADLLKKRGHELVFAGFGTSLQLANDYPFDAVYEIDTDNSNSRNKLKKIISEVDMLISSMDLQSVLLAKDLGKPTVYIDCLFWFWEDIPKPLFDIDLYVREKSINDVKDCENEKKFKLKIKNLYSVGPIISEIKKENRIHQAIVSYGGGEASHWYKVGRDTNYPDVMTSILVNYVDWKSFDRVIIATGKHILKHLSSKFKNTQFEFTNCSSHFGFLKEMSKSEIILTTAGLVTTQEAFQSETPLIFLPPSNNSHYVLLDELRDQIPDIPSVHLADFMSRLDLRGKPEEESIPAVMNQLRMLENSPILQTKLGEKINLLVKTRDKWSELSVNNNKRFMKNLGQNGAKDVVDKIETILLGNL